MIVVDTSALIAILGSELESPDCEAVLENEPDLRISTGTLAEAMIVAHGRGGAEEMRELIDRLGLNAEPLTTERAFRAGDAHARWGKGKNSARLNFGDCFAYALAMELDCPLLFVGNDFARTDVKSAL